MTIRTLNVVISTSNADDAQKVREACDSLMMGYTCVHDEVTDVTTFTISEYASPHVMVGFYKHLAGG